MTTTELEEGYEAALKQWLKKGQSGNAWRFFFFAGAQFGQELTKRIYDAERVAEPEKTEQ